MRASWLLEWVVLFMVMGLVLLMPGMSGAITEIRDQQNMDNFEVASKTLVIIGASYAGGWKPQKTVAGYQVVNKGVSGQQSFEMLARFETDVVALKPDAVIIWGFINDVFRNDRDRIDQTLNRARESLVAMVESARKANIRPILATEVTMRGKAGFGETVSGFVGGLIGKESYQDYVNKQVIQTNRWIRDMATREQIALFDYEAILSDGSGARKKEFAKDDGSHISSAGYEAITEYTERQLKD
jgi:lysophospholipase L1-like esterase